MCDIHPPAFHMKNTSSVFLSQFLCIIYALYSQKKYKFVNFEAVNIIY